MSFSSISSEQNLTTYDRIYLEMDGTRFFLVMLDGFGVEKVGLREKSPDKLERRWEIKASLDS